MVREHEISITVSVGISLYPADGAEVEALVKRADLAMYGAKRQGKNTYQLYHPSMDSAGAERLAQEKMGRQASMEQPQEVRNV